MIVLIPIIFTCVCLWVLSKLSLAKETARRMSCDGHLAHIGIALRIYSDIYDGKYPHLDGAEGLDLLRKAGVLDYPLYFTCPSCNTEPASPGEPLTEKHLDYIYRGGHGINDNPKISILYDKKGNHDKFGNILFVDTWYQGFYGEDWQRNLNHKNVRRRNDNPE